MSSSAPDAGTSAPAQGPQSAAPPSTDSQHNDPERARTPVLPRISSLLLVPKHPNYPKKMYDEMLPLMTQVSFDTFMSTFLPSGKDLTEAELRSVGDFSGLCNLFSKGNIPLESKMYPAVASVIQKVIDIKKADFTYKDTANTRESNFNDKCPDGCIYPTDELAEDTWELDPEASEKACKTYGRERGPWIAKMAYAFAEVPFEFKREVSLSAFYNDSRYFLRDNEAAISQIASYASEILLRQHRVFLFMVCITRTHARVIRWDRAAAVVSESVDLKQTPRLLLNFISRLVTSSSRARGHDETVTFASKDQIKLLKSCTFANPKAQKMLEDIVDGEKDFPIRAVTCPRLDATEPPMTLLIGKHRSGTYSPTGRATRGYIALDTDEKRLVFLKDSWRPDSRSIQPEFETYKILKEKQVQHVATALGGGDVGAPHPQKTINQDCFDPRVRPTKRVHHRIVLREVGEPLADYKSSIEMISVVYDAVVGHFQAWNQADILHRDISVNNILINIDSPDGRRAGLLIDWDLCKGKKDLEKATLNGRSGTWAFLSARLLQYPWKPHELSDDLESFVHVLTWLALRFHEHQFTPPACLQPDAKAEDIFKANSENDGLCLYKSVFFDSEYVEVGCEYHKGGQTKLSSIIEGKLTLIRFTDKSGPLPQLIALLYRLLKRHYDATAALDTSKAVHADKGRATKTAEPAAVSIYKPDPVWLQSGAEESDSMSSDSSATTRSVDPMVVPKSTRVLDNHFAFLKKFAQIMNDTAHVYFDKTADQFASLKQYVKAPTAGPSGTQHGSKARSRLSTASVGSRHTTPGVSAGSGVSYNLRSTSSGVSSVSLKNVGSSNAPATRSSSRYGDSGQESEGSPDEIPVARAPSLEDALDTLGAGSSRTDSRLSVSSDVSNANSLNDDEDPEPLPPTRNKRKRETTPSSRGRKKRRGNTRKRVCIGHRSYRNSDAGSPDAPSFPRGPIGSGSEATNPDLQHILCLTDVPVLVLCLSTPQSADTTHKTYLRQTDEGRETVPKRILPVRHRDSEFAEYPDCAAYLPRRQADEPFRNALTDLGAHTSALKTSKSVAQERRR
ncbi:hypothetical protein NM688_g5800 [Phlebia brevispora]|uniref:Uncharacterized protein n=1 Tax=Phlebia brevispora TaxID=194682 RepID=A0ACC1SPU5_9APHY|nr:hypothetical protein NM688_g5800 [Phlebia brevispora]